MLCDELKVYVPQDGPYGLEPEEGGKLVEEETCYLKSEVDAAIAELKKKLMPCLNGDCILTCEVVEKYGKENAELKAKLEDVQASAYSDVVDANMENRRLRRALWVTRTAMAKSEKDRWNAYIDCGNRRNRKDPAYVKTGKLLEVSEWRKLWADNERKCRAKAEEYK